MVKEINVIPKSMWEIWKWEPKNKSHGMLENQTWSLLLSFQFITLKIVTWKYLYSKIQFNLRAVM